MLCNFTGDEFVTKYLVWLFFRRSSLKVDSHREEKIIFSCSWVKTSYSNTLGWEPHIQLLLDESITSKYSWLKSCIQLLLAETKSVGKTCFLPRFIGNLLLRFTRVSNSEIHWGSYTFFWGLLGNMLLRLSLKNTYCRGLLGNLLSRLTRESTVKIQ